MYINGSLHEYILQITRVGVAYIDMYGYDGKMLRVASRMISAQASRATVKFTSV